MGNKRGPRSLIGLNMDQYLMEQPYFYFTKLYLLSHGSTAVSLYIHDEYYTTILEWVRFKYPSETNKNPGFLTEEKSRGGLFSRNPFIGKECFQHAKQILTCHFLQIQKRIEM